MFRDLYLHKHNKYTNEHNIANIVIISSLLTQRSVFLMSSERDDICIYFTNICRLNLHKQSLYNVIGDF